MNIILGFQGRIFGCTGNALEEDINLFLDSGANQVFIKPVDANTIVQQVVTWISSILRSEADGPIDNDED